MAVTAREKQMLDLAEEGLSADEIASRMGIKRESVVRTLSLLSNAIGPDRAREAAIRSGTRRLASALITAGFAPGFGASSGVYL